MIELISDRLSFSFRDVHPEATMSISFQRTLRIPDNDREYPLTPGLGSFPLRHVDDFSSRVPKKWIEHGGVMFPMHQAEALWIFFNSRHDPFISCYEPKRRADYPFAVKIAAGRINAVSGKAWDKGLRKDPQNYVVAPGQPWIDGYCIEKGIIRQFVAMPLGMGVTAEEQLTGKGVHGGLQIEVIPMKREVYEQRFPEKLEEDIDCSPGIWFSRAETVNEMGLAPGGRMKQEIYEDPYDISDWDLKHASRCFVHITNSAQWKEITGGYPPLKPPTAKDYSKAGLPWFEYYSDGKAIAGAKKLAGLTSVGSLLKTKKKKETFWDEDVEAAPVIPLGKRTVREWTV